MARQLTELTIRSLPFPETGDKKHFDPSLAGFGVRCTSRSKSFFVQFGEARRIKTLGKWPDLSLRDARAIAKQFLATPPPIMKPVVTFNEARAWFLEDCERRLRPASVERYRYSLRAVNARNLDAIPKNLSDPHQISALKAFFNWCIDRDLCEHNPYARRKAIMRQRDRVLTDAEVARILAYDHPPYSEIVKLLCYTGQRRGQFANFNPQWVQGDEITFPSTIMKSGRAHTIPIVDIERWLKPYSFRGWSKAKKRIDLKTGVTDWVLHDLRRYFSSTMARLAVPLHITEFLLDHRTQVSGVAAIYNRYSFLPEMKDALIEYVQHINGLVD